MSPSDRTGQRTAAEREAARKDRERRRALRRGEPVADPQDPQPEGAARNESDAAHEPARSGDQAPRPVAGRAAAPDQSTQPAAASGGQAQPAASARTAAQPARQERQPADDTGKEAPAGQATQAWDVSEHLDDAGEAPSPVAAAASARRSEEPSADLSSTDGAQAPPRRASWRPRGEAHRLPSAPPPVAGSERQPLRRFAGRSSKREGHSFRARAGAVGALAVVAVAVWAVVMLIQHIGGSKPGKAPTAARAPEVRVVIPEGEDRLQIAAIAHKDGLTGNYLHASVASSALQPKRFGAPADIPNLEGFLFPATYNMPVHGTVKGLVERQLEAFQERFGDEEQKHARALGLTSYKLLIVASMIEREAYLPKDRPLVAAVIYNRLHQGMPLGIDSTIRFALNDFTKPLTEAQLKMPSPYNTRLNKGLPPTPISNPGMEAIEAAAHPSHVGYLYYVDGADGCGDLVFSNTEAEFERNKAAYDEALAANGGHAPTCKRK